MNRLSTQLFQRARDQGGTPSPEEHAWRAEMRAFAQVQTDRGWAFHQVAPNLEKLMQGHAAGAGWSVELYLLTERFEEPLPLSCGVVAELAAEARRHPGPVRSSDQ
jgi:hypothetical protein